MAPLNSGGRFLAEVNRTMRLLGGHFNGKTRFNNLPSVVGAVALATKAFDAQFGGVLMGVQKDELGVVAAADKQASGLPRRMHISFMRGGFRPANRDGQGGVPLAYSRSRMSFRWYGGSWEQVSQALCVEVIAGDTPVEDFNTKLCVDCGLAPLTPHSIACGCLACGHGNMGYGPTRRA